MEIGINSNSIDIGGYGRFGENTYKKLRKHGYLYTDLSMSNTEGTKINQTHGTWRWSLRDSTVEDRAERMDKMEVSKCNIQENIF